MAAQLLNQMSKDERFHIPGRLDLKQDVGIEPPSIMLITDAQLLAMTLNEICVLRGKGQFFWIPKYEYKVSTLFHGNTLPSKFRTDR